MSAERLAPESWAPAAPAPLSPLCLFNADDCQVSLRIRTKHGGGRNGGRTGSASEGRPLPPPGLVTTGHHTQPLDLSFPIC